MEELDRQAKRQGIQFFDKYQIIMVAFIGMTIFMFFVLLYIRFLVDINNRYIVDNFQAVNFAIHFGAWTWFIIRSITFRMRLNDARKAEEDI